MRATENWDVGLNLLFLHPRMAGVRVVATQLLQAILQRSISENDHRFRLFVTRHGAECLRTAEFDACVDQLGDRLSIVTAPIDPKRKLSKLAYEQSRFLRMVKDVRLTHSFDYTFPLLSKCHNIVTVHDLNYLNFPETFSLSQRWIRKILVPLTLKRADRVLTVSGTSKDEIESVFRVEADRLRVVYNGFQPPALAPQPTSKHRFVLAIGTLKSHKNYDRLIRAFAKVADSTDLCLAIVGRDDGSQVGLESLAGKLGIGERVKFFGFVSSDELANLFQASKLFVFPSLYEGFGMPILEAMSRDLPVACSNLPVLKEIGGDAATYFDPYNVDEISTAMRQVLEARIDVDKLVDLGRKQTTKFSWSSSAGTVLSIYDEVLAKAG